MATRKTSTYDSRFKSWRGPMMRKNSAPHTGDAKSKSKTNHARVEPNECGSAMDDIDRFRFNIKSSIKSARQWPSNSPPPNPRTVSLPTVTWSRPPIVDHKTRRSAFEFQRPSNICVGGPVDVGALKKRSHLVYDELTRAQLGNVILRKEVERLRGWHVRIESLAKEVLEVRNDNEFLSREIEKRRHANAHSCTNGLG